MTKPDLWKRKRHEGSNNLTKAWWMLRWCGCFGCLIAVHLQLSRDWLWNSLSVPEATSMEESHLSSSATTPIAASIEEHKAALKYMGNKKTNTGWNIDTLCLQKKRADQQFIVYGVGAGEDISWDIGMVEHYGATVVMIDPTEKAKRHVDSILATKLYGNDPNVIRFLPEGLSDEIGEITFAMPANPDHVSMRAVDLADADMTKTVSATVRRLRDFMASLQHEYLDVLKIDIEGAEYNVLEAMLRENDMPFTQLLVEYHDRFLTDRTRHDDLLKQLEQAGFVELWSQNGGQERGYIKRNDLDYCANGVSKRSAATKTKLRKERLQ